MAEGRQQVRYDYVSPGLTVVTPDAAFPHMIAANTDICSWPYLRREIPHRWYLDSRVQFAAFLTRDEAVLLHNLALPFQGRPALEIGCWLGWSACHLALAGVMLDVIDPVLSQEGFRESVEESLTTAGVRDRVRLFPGSSPQMVPELASTQSRRWSLIFIDGDHEAPAPLLDCIACAAHAEADAMIVMHDLNAPAVGEGLANLRGLGWNVLLYQTMQIMGGLARKRLASASYSRSADRLELAKPPHRSAGQHLNGRKTYAATKAPMFEWHQVKSQVVEPEVLVLAQREAFSLPESLLVGVFELAVQFVLGAAR
jgi:hypothetical protein